MDIGFIGAGNMGGAILTGYLSSDMSRDNGVLVYDMNRELCERLAEGYPRIAFCESGAELCEKSDITVIGVKPQVIEGVLDEIKEKAGGGRLVISMAAGVSLAYLAEHLGGDRQIIRIMPNTPAKVGEAMIAVCCNENVSKENHDEAMKLLSSVGRAEEVAEDLMDCVIGVSGSSPAYTYMYIEALAQAAVDNGMSEEKAKIFAAQAVLGAAKMALESTESLEQLRINVCSPNGTTIEAVEKLFENGFMDKVKEGFQAAVDRSIEMTGEKA